MLLFKKLHEQAVLPSRGNPWDAGLDLTIVKPVVLRHNEVVTAETGLAVAIPQGNVGFITIRSSMGKKGVQIANAPGVIDPGYRGEIKLMLIAHDGNQHGTLLPAGTRVAQLVVCHFYEYPVQWTPGLPRSDGREQGGFGSTNRDPYKYTEEEKARLLDGLF